MAYLYITKAVFTKKIRLALQETMVTFAGHSFLIRAATAAAKAGMEDSTIRAVYRSCAFECRHIALVIFPKLSLDLVPFLRLDQV